MRFIHLVPLLIAACGAPEELISRSGPPESGSLPGTAGDPTGSDEADAEAEHPWEADDGVSGVWLDGPAAGVDIVRTAPTLTLSLVNRGIAPRTVVVTVAGDGGSLQALRRLPSSVFTVGTGPVTVPVDFGSLASPVPTHAGQIAVELRSCPLGDETGAGCVTTVAPVLYFHRLATGGWQVYDDVALCALHGCGDLASSGLGELGGGRVLGGGPFHGLRPTDPRAPEGPEVNRRFLPRNDDLGRPTARPCDATDPTCNTNPTGAP